MRLVFEESQQALLEAQISMNSVVVSAKISLLSALRQHVLVAS